MKYTFREICKSNVLGCYLQGACRCTLADFHCLDLKCELQDTKPMVIEWYLQDA